MRLLGVLILFLLAGFCGFGFMASFESPEFLGWRIGYSVIGLLCLAGIGWVLLTKPRS